MQGIKRRITYVFFYEAITLVLISMAFHAWADEDSGHPVLLGIITVVLAVIWNTLYNTLFELWEKTLITRGRGLRRRVLHAVGFEVGFVAVTLPIFSWWLSISIWDAFLLDAGLTMFFMFFTFLYNWLFDLIFGLPISTQ
ncbi:PACE efflux transporter [Vibrio parahaemolyticus]|nr:PACE efflux transporter [Vibrio parahaemolyticus]EJC6985748.1 PACE efflux transporter [Vibrio parahaemolyticus]EJG1903246.1 PACE efflux transporter [Vibrio parahaemolyticus]EJO2021903.1 PACE efflux transporter [Vibrio parahaemolyticus]